MVTGKGLRSRLFPLGNTIRGEKPVSATTYYAWSNSDNTIYTQNDNPVAMCDYSFTYPNEISSVIDRAGLNTTLNVVSSNPNLTIQNDYTGTKSQAGVETERLICTESQSSRLPVSSNWTSVCFGNGKFVAVSDYSNTGAYSTDGMNWTQSNIWYSYKSVCFGNGKFVAIGNNDYDGTGSIMAYSEDGINWSYSKLPVISSDYSPWQSVCYGNGKFIAIAQNSNKGAYSTDGVTWSTFNLPSTEAWYTICYGDGKFVIIQAQSDKAVYSTNGINWTQTTLPAAVWQSVCYGNGKFVAVADNAYGIVSSAYSTDGINWTESTIPIQSSWLSVCYGNGKFVAVAWNSKRVAYSNDGVVWTETAPTLPDYLWSVCYGNNKFVAVCYYSDVVSTSVDGVEWSTGIQTWQNSQQQEVQLSDYQLSITSGTPAVNDTLDLTYTTAFNMVVNNIIYSRDRINDKDNKLTDFYFEIKTDAYEPGIPTWTESTLPSTDYWTSVCFGDGKFVAIAGDSYNPSNSSAYSIDGINWVSTTLPFSQEWANICYGNGKFVAIGSPSYWTPTNKLAYSEDGITWTEGTLPSTDYWTSVCFGDGKFVAISRSSVAYSTDGINWIQAQTPYISDLRFISYGNGIFLTIPSYNYEAMVSTDGINWTIVSSPSYYTIGGLWFGNGKFIVLEDNFQNMYYSTDGTNWTRGHISLSIYDMVYAEDKFVGITTGTSATGGISTDGINWTETTLPSSANWRSICYGNGKFVAVARDSNKVACFTKVGGNTQFFLPINNATYINPITVDWGDGNQEVISSGTYPSHTYSTAGTYEVRVHANSGKMPYIYWNSANSSSYKFSNRQLTKIKSALMESYKGTSVTTGFNWCFSGCYNLTSIPTDLFRYNTAVTDFSDCLSGCTALTSIPQDLFKHNLAVTNFYDCFQNCPSLTSIPKDLFKYNTSVTSFSYCFQACPSLTAVPQDLFKYNTSATNFSYCFYGCTNLQLNTNIFCNEATEMETRFANVRPNFSNCFQISSFSGTQGTAPQLWNYTYSSTPYCSNCFTGHSTTSLTNYNDIPVEWGGPTATDFTFEIKTDAYTAGNTQFYLPINNETYINPITVDWGDGNSEVLSSGIYPSHTYDTAGTYEVKISANSGKMPYLYWLDVEGSTYKNSNRQLTKLKSALMECYTGTDVVTNFSRCFYGCSSLTSIPQDLFKYNTATTSFSWCFQNCSSLTSIPQDLFKYSTAVTGFAGCFSSCSSLTSIPTDLFRYNTAVTDFSSCFNGCTSLTSIPTDLFRYNQQAYNFNSCFANCYLLTSIPADLFRYNTKATQFGFCFNSCYRLQLNSNIFCDEATEMSTRFANVRPDFLYCFNINSFSGTQGTAPQLWNYTYKSTPTSTSCFTGHSTTSLTNYNDIPSGWK